ncbi:Phosphopantetheine attachment site [Epibacterium ulvae]|uniref:Phosphopantetheine attachment site n=1 Tax=Epibacterium ulvae TaxID=1156985 RepID=A0A1G5QSW1_9RHOB|nr:DUF6005 family protein [Epibacterium ulvae]SCZ64766.1 Phosphopantetheine attachment site [Epibacterium ulvae]
MTFDTILTAIEATLTGPLKNEHMHNFGPTAVLNDDLHMDSVLMINLLLHLETDHGIEVPEREFSKDNFHTVSDLINLMMGVDTPSTSDATAPAPSDITVHCLVSCLCAAIRRTKGVDFRPFYFGTWDSSFAITGDQRFAYHSEDLSHDTYFEWATHLYGLPITQWYDHTRSKAENLTHFETLVAAKTPAQELMVILDMYHLPERENKFNQNPFPHFVLIEPTDDPDIWLLNDPDYRWRGQLPRTAILNAMAQPTVAGGYILDATQVSPPDPAVLAEYFTESFKGADNPLTTALRGIVEYHCDAAHSARLANLQQALRELPVLSLRKYAYEHAFAFFWKQLDTPFEHFDAQCDRVEELCESFRKIHYLAARLSHTKDRAPIAELFTALHALDVLEFEIKHSLKAQFDLWRAKALTPDLQEEPA